MTSRWIEETAEDWHRSRDIYMRILGIDPGYAILGWGILDLKGNHFSVVDYGAITTDAKTEMPYRLQHLYVPQN